LVFNSLNNYLEVSDQKVPIARLAKPPKAQFTFVNEYFGGKRNAASGTLGTDTI
jgi:hypothetical protein